MRRLKCEKAESYIKNGDIQEAIDAFLEFAEKLLQDGYYAGAYNVLSQALQLDENNVEVLKKLVDTYEGLGLIREGRRISERLKGLGVRYEIKEDDELRELQKRAQAYYDYIVGIAATEGVDAAIAELRRDSIKNQSFTVANGRSFLD